MNSQATTSRSSVPRAGAARDLCARRLRDTVSFPGGDAPRADTRGARVSTSKQFAFQADLQEKPEMWQALEG
jgi:hypothetical protein